MIIFYIMHIIFLTFGYYLLAKLYVIEKKYCHNSVESGDLYFVNTLLERVVLIIILIFFYPHKI